MADAELLAASQRAFDNPQSRRELTLLTGPGPAKACRAGGVELQLSCSQVTAPRDGVAVFSDANDWLGKPVVTGERIMQLADPHQPAKVRILLPVADAIALELRGRRHPVPERAYPLDPLRGKILETSYQAQPGPTAWSPYRLLATIESPPSHARLGLHGTAKLLWRARAARLLSAAPSPGGPACLERPLMLDPADLPLPSLRDDLRLARRTEPPTASRPGSFRTW